MSWWSPPTTHPATCPSPDQAFSLTRRQGTRVLSSLLKLQERSEGHTFLPTELTQGCTLFLVFSVSAIPFFPLTTCGIFVPPQQAALLEMLLGSPLGYPSSPYPCQLSFLSPIILPFIRVVSGCCWNISKENPICHWE